MGSSEIAWGNLWRHKGRTVFLLLLVIFSVTTVISMVTVTRAMRAEIGNAFDQTGANILILPQQTRRFGYAGVALPSTSVSQSYLPERNTDLVRTIENRESIAVVAPELLAVLESAQGPVLAVGVRFPAELRLKKWWRVRVLPPGPETRYAPVFPPLPVGASEVLLGAQVAQRWQKDVGDTVQLDGQSFRVAGVLDPLGSDEDRAVWVDLGVLQKLTGRLEQVSLIEMAALCNTCPIDEIVRQVGEKLPGSRVSAIKAAVEGRRAVVDRFGRFAVALSATVGTLGSLAIGLTMLGSVRERTREIGLLRALGSRRWHILAVFCLEAGVLGLGGGLAGSVLGTAVAGALGPSIAGMKVAIPWSPLLMGAGTAGSAVMALLASLVPAIQATRVEPVRALRFL